MAVLSHDVTTITENCTLLEMLRRRELATLEEGLVLLEQEAAWRQQRANVLHARARDLSQRKIDVLAAHVQQVQQQYASNSGRSVTDAEAASQRGGAQGNDAASLSGKKPPQSVLSDGKSAPSAPSARRGAGRTAKPQAKHYACGPLTKKAASEHYAAYWQRQAFLGAD